ncbi:tripartite tricarboxylate transporter permease [Halobellus captivus]|uniref:tripartite tricarboxylate transporter permease n=1 Tax=Halobellus captivus TaxID=2592614 RepID=UPI00119C911D|nr:tripartite tricarboxylate transporter permease [Halobellus captivus]
MATANILLDALAQVLTPEVMLMVFVGVVFGFIIGVIPGLGPVIGIVLLFPLTIAMDPLPAVVLLASVYPAGVYGGSVTAVLINTPGDPSSTVTTFDGYPMTKRGDGVLALGVTLASSIIGGVLSVLALLLIAPPFARIALQIGPSIVFAIGLAGVVILVIVSRGSMLKGLVASAFGLLLSVVGYSSFRGVERFTFGVDYLEQGIPMIPLIVGLFAISEAMMLLYQGGSIEEDKEGSERSPETSPDKNILRRRLQDMNRGILETLRRPASVLRSSSIGIAIGLVPGAGSIVANFVSYYVGRTFSKRGDEFGTGAIEGLIAAESSNNAATAATLIPTLVLGVPGGIAAAILLGVLQLKNIRVGPQLFVETPELAYGVVLALLFANIVMLFVGYSLSSLIKNIVEIRVEIIAPMIVILAILGGFANNFSGIDSIAVIIFGILGFAMRKLGYSPISVVFGFILGPILETYYLRAVQAAGGDQLAVIFAPIPATIIGVAGLVLVYQLISEVKDIRRRVNIGN